MEHIELAGIHSGDSACVIPSLNITPDNLKTIKEYTMKIAKEMKVCGLMNMQYAIENGIVYVLEANPRASRTVPLVSKVCNIQMVKLATQVITGRLTGNESPVSGLKESIFTHYGVKEAVFPFNMFPEVDPVLGPEMRSTGEVLGLAETFGEAFYKAQEATKTKLPVSGTVLISVNDRDKAEVAEVAKGFAECGFHILATGGTYDLITANGIQAEKIYKLHQGRPNILDAVANGQIDIIVNTPIDKKGAADDSYIRKAAIKGKIPYVTTMAAAKATIAGMKAIRNNMPGVKSIQEFHKGIR
jgi:carbamoyl-phosphate synthase large subunit